MSASGRSSRQPADSPIRQQLDELDALMQRMLALPVDASAATQQPPAVTAGPSADAMFEVPADPLHDSILSPDFLALPEISPAVELQTLDPLESDRPEPDNVNTLVQPTKVIVAWWLRPLWLVDHSFDLASSPLGPVGRGLRSAWGKGLLGVTGLACLVTAVVWLLWEGLGWTW